MHITRFVKSTLVVGGLVAAMAVPMFALAAPSRVHVVAAASCAKTAAPLVLRASARARLASARCATSGGVRHARGMTGTHHTEVETETHHTEVETETHHTRVETETHHTEVETETHSIKASRP